MPTFLVWIVAKPYVAGDSLQKALTKVDDLWNTSKIMSTVDLLGEDVKTAEEIELMVQIYLDLLDGLQGKKDYTTVSLKPTALGLNFSEELCVTNLTRILDKAMKYDIKVTLDMENTPYTDKTLELYRNLKPKYPIFGTVLQTRLFRTEKDIENLPPNSHIRLCIGIYNEAKEMALQKKSEMKEKLVELVEPLHAKGHFIAVATHDEPTIRSIFKIIDQKKLTKDDIEFQFLLGVPREKIHKEVQDRGLHVRQYVPFATKKKYATRYALRRFEENPNMAIYVLRNLLGQRWFQILFGIGIVAVTFIGTFIVMNYNTLF
jgi:proline dehydrogenase